MSLALPLPQTATDQTGRRLIAVVALWGAVVAIAGAAHLFNRLDPQLFAPLVTAGVVLPMLAYAASPALRAFFADFGLRRLTVFHIWRIPAAIAFFLYADHLPAGFVRNAAWGDLLAGTLALALIWLRPTRRRYWAFHLIGFADFVSAVGTGLAFTLAADPLMATIRDLPLVLIPLFGVGLSGTSHLIAFDLLRRPETRVAP